MAWKNITPDGSVRFYSLADSVEILHDYFITFWSNLTPGMVIFMIIVCIMLIAIGVIFSIYYSIRNGYVTG